VLTDSQAPKSSMTFVDHETMNEDGFIDVLQHPVDSPKNATDREKLIEVQPLQ
jgi:hypothetical protein